MEENWEEEIAVEEAAPIEVFVGAARNQAV